MRYLYTFSAFILSFVPFVAAALSHSRIDELLRAGGVLMTTFNIIIGILFVIATLVFLWGVIQFIASSADEVKRQKAKAIMTWGIVGLAVMAAVWGIVSILVGYFLPEGTGPVRGVIPREPGRF